MIPLHERGATATRPHERVITSHSSAHMSPFLSRAPFSRLE